SAHDCYNPAELQRVLREYPGEKECVWYNRVIEYLVPTRAVLIYIWYLQCWVPDTISLPSRWG
ncbi:hypothetical protein EDC04DRAFT_2569834, partial [Pisolithus marmoratus]